MQRSISSVSLKKSYGNFTKTWLGFARLEPYQETVLILKGFDVKEAHNFFIPKKLHSYEEILKWGKDGSTV